MTKTLFKIALILLISLFSENLFAQSSDIYTSEFHKQNVGKILFSNKPIKIGNEDPDQFKTTFFPGEYIYAIAYLEKPFEDYESASLNTHYSAFIDYKPFISNPKNVKILDFKHIEGDEPLSYYLIELIPDPELATKAHDAELFGELFSKLTPRKHTLDLKYISYREEGNPITGPKYGYRITGKITLEYKNFDAEKIKSDSEIAYKNALDYRAKLRTLPEIFSEENVPFEDPDMCVENIEAMIMKSSKWKDKIEHIVRVQVCDANLEWFIQKSSTGIPINKINEKYIGFIFKGKDGWCYSVEKLRFVKEYEGAGIYSKPRYDNYAFSTRINCDNVE